MKVFEQLHHLSLRVLFSMLSGAILRFKGEQITWRPGRRRCSLQDLVMPRE